MRKVTPLGILLLLALLAGCGVSLPAANPAPVEETSLPAPAVRITSVPDARKTLNAFLEAWKISDYATMYTMLSAESQASISQDDFVKKYRETMNRMTLRELSHEILTSNNGTQTAQATFKVTYNTYLVGSFEHEMTAGLKMENGEWRILWNDGLIFPEMAGGNYLSMDYQTASRGIIYDRDGVALVSQTDAYAIGLVPTNIIPDQEGSLMSALSQLLGVYPIQAQALYNDRRDVYWYIPIGEAPAEEVDRRFSYYSSLGGIVLSPYTARLYAENGIASQTLGYVAPIQESQVDEYVRQGYSPAARVGQAGIEQWGEEYLSGTSGGTLYLVGADGKVIRQVGSKSEAQPAGSVTLTLDRDLQVQAEKAIEGFRAAAVVIERDTGRILAMASSPDFDPNYFDPNNRNSADGIQEIFNNVNQPLVNRVTQGQYPLGSVFKVITFAAALESGTYTPDLQLECGYEWNELTDQTRYDWTWQHCQDEFAAEGACTTKPSGTLTLSQGLMRSCNPWFWHIGLDLYRQGRTTAVADMARAFGLGQTTGIGVLPELPGQINNLPTSGGEIEAVNQAIGQGDVLVTPLQVANFMAALGNGGTLYRPQIVEKVTDSSGAETTIFKPEARATLPLKPETLEALQTAMLAVVRDPRGTAVHRFRNINIPIYGKTGTAESGSGLPHAWFAGYTDAQIEGFPDVAIAVIVENEGEGSDYGAPIFKRIVESYFYGQPRSLYWWEANFGLTRTPTPLGGEQTPQP